MFHTQFILVEQSLVGTAFDIARKMGSLVKTWITSALRLTIHRVVTFIYDMITSLAIDANPWPLRPIFFNPFCFPLQNDMLKARNISPQQLSPS